MSLYPSFENLTIGKEVEAQNKIIRSMMNEGPLRANYNQLASDFLGLDLSKLRYDQYGNAIYGSPVNQEAAIIPAPGNAVAIPQPVVKRDPVEVTNGVREIKVTKNNHGQVGLQLREQNTGVFVTYVEANSPAASAGLRFGDQVLKIHDQLTAGRSGHQAMNLIKNGPSNIAFIIRDRPLERVITLTKNSQGYIGFAIEKGKIKCLVKDSSAARNGVLTSHQLLEVNGINVIGVTDKAIQDFLLASGNTVRITVIPSVFFDHMVKKLGRKYLKNMDRSEPVV